MTRPTVGFLLLAFLIVIPGEAWAQQSWLDGVEDGNPALIYSTYAPEQHAVLLNTSIAVDANGNVHLSAHEYTMVARDPFHFDPANQAVFTKLNSAGDAYLYTLRYLHARGTAVAVDPSGNAYYTGVIAPSVEFETTPGALNQPDGHGLVLKVSPEGEILYAARISAQPAAITVDSAGRAYLTGYALADFTATPASYKPEIGEIRCSEQYGLNPHACPDAFAARLSADASRFEWATFFGGVSDESAGNIVVDSTGAVYIAGETTSGDMPVTAGAMQPEYGGGEQFGPFSYGDGFLAKFSADGSTLLYATYMGGLRGDFVTGLAVSGDDSLKVLGTTQSSDFPVSGNAMQPDYGGGGEQPTRAGDLFLVRFAASGAVLESTYLGGPLQEYAGSILALPEGRLAIATNESRSSSPCDWPGRVAIFANGQIERVFATPQVLAASGQSIVSGDDQTLFAAGLGSIAPPFGLTENAANTLGVVLVTHLDLTDTSNVEPTCIANAASLHVGGQLGYPNIALAPGEIVSFFGRDLGPVNGVAAEFDQDGRLPTVLGGSRVLINGREIPLLYVSERQINAIAPFDFAEDTAAVRFESQHGTTREYRIPVVPALPGIFSTAQDGSGQAAALNQDGTLNSSANRAPRGSIISIYATGLGRLTPTPADGSTVPLEPPFPTANEGLQVYIAAPFETGAAGMEVLYAGAAPGLVAGVAQINARIPVTANIGATVPIRIVVDSTSERSQATVTIAVSE